MITEMKTIQQLGQSGELKYKTRNGIKSYGICQIRRFINNGKLKSTFVYGVYLVSKEEIDRFNNDNVSYSSQKSRKKK